jgi:hypothetical protein
MSRVRDVLEYEHFRVLSQASLVGARWLTSEVEKNFLRADAARAQLSAADPNT